LVANREGFPMAHEVFDGNRGDGTTLPDMLDALGKRTDNASSSEKTVIVDRGLSSIGNLKLMSERGYRYVVPAKQKERDAILAQLNDEANWTEVGAHEPKIRIKRVPPDVVTAIKATSLEKKAAKAAAATKRVNKETDPAKLESLNQKAKAAALSEAEARFALEHKEQWVLCVSAGRTAKDKAIREKQEQRLRQDVEKLSKRVAPGALKLPAKVHEAIGRLKERYPRVAKYFAITFDENAGVLRFEENHVAMLAAENLDGSYLLKTDRLEISDDEIWRTYMLLTRVEAAFRDIKSPLMERPIFHQLEHRVQTHVFVCILAYHLLVAIEKSFRDRGLETSWESLREQLRTHQVCTVVMPTTDGRVLRLRHTATPDKIHKQIYDTIGIPNEVIRPIKTWASI